MQTPSLDPKSEIYISVQSFLKTLKEFKIQFNHDPNYKIFWIPIDLISVDLGKFPKIRGEQGDIEISITRYSNAIAIWISDSYNKKLIYLPPDKIVEYHNGDIVIEF